MILSRTLAKSRIARAERPGWVAAWIPVVFDFVCMLAYCYGVYALLLGWIWSAQPPTVLLFGVAFLFLFVPLQAVLITSSLWASKSRWTDEEGTHK